MAGVEKKYKSLNGPFGSTFVFRLFISLFVVIGFLMLISPIWEDEMNGAGFVVAFAFFFVAYHSTRFSVIKYNSKEIIVENVRGRYCFSGEDFIEIKPLRSYLNFYIIVFKNENSFLYTVSSSRYFLNDFANEDASYMENEIRSTLSQSKQA